MSLEDKEILARKDENAITFVDALGGLVIAGLIGLAANWVATGAQPQQALPGMLILLALSLLGVGLARAMPFYLPDVAWITLVTIIATLPDMPGSTLIAEEVGKVGFLALATSVLAYAGLALSPAEFRIARQSGWKIVIVAFCVMFGTYFGSVVIAHLALLVTD